VAFIALLAITLFVIAVDRGARRSNDFDNFHDGAASVWHEGELFLEKGLLRYPASFQVMISPLGALPLGVAAAIWALLNLASSGVCAWGLGRLAGVPPREQIPAWLLVSPFLVNNITLGQSGPLLLALVTLGVLAAAGGRAAPGGAAIAAAGLLKVFPMGFLAVLVAGRRAGGAAAGAAAAIALVALWAVLAVGPRVAVDDLARWWTEVRTEQTPQNMIEVVRGLRYNNQGLAITIVRSLTTDFSWAPQRAAKGSVQVLSLPLWLAWGLYGSIVAALAATSAAAAWRVWRLGGAGGRHLLGLYAMAAPALLAVSPIVWTHYFLWLLPAGIYRLDRPRLVTALGVASLLAVFSVPARALGFHMFLGLALFVLCARRLWAETGAASQRQATT